MKTSILLPTRDRLEYLKFAVESVLRQDASAWQLVVSDNCSKEDIHGYLSSLGDPRIVYHRTERPVDVTENWNRALAHSDGDYIIMLGDDDALLGRSLRRIEELTQEFGDPDVIYTKALQFTYPAVNPAFPTGYLMDNGCAEFFAGVSQPFVLEHSRALELVRAAMSFRVRYDFNAQFAFISRRLIDSLSVYGDFYQSAFPDYYSMNAVFLRARQIVVDPNPRVVIGVTPKSYGYFYVNNREAEGREFLEAARAPESAGTNMNVGWLSAATALERGVGAELGLRVDHRRYRLVQAAHVYKLYLAGDIGRDEVRLLGRELPLAERWAYGSASAVLALVHRVLPARLKAAFTRLTMRRVGQLPTIAPTIVEGRYKNMLEVLDARDGDA